MSNLLKKDIDFINKHYDRDTTIENIISIANTLIQKAQHYAPLANTRDLIKILQNKEYILAYVKSYTATSTQRGKMGSIYGLMDKYEKYRTTKKSIFSKSYLTFFENEMRRVSKADQDKKNNTLNQHRENVVSQKLTIQDLYDAIDYWEKKDKYGIYHLILATYTYILPRRLDLRHAMYINKIPTKPKATENYINISKGKVRLVFYNFKTANKLQFWDRTLKNDEFDYRNSILKVHPRFNPEKLKDIMIESYRQNPRKYFIQIDNSFYSQSGFSVLVSTAFRKSINKSINATDLRSIVISEIFNNPRVNIPTKYETEMALDMGQKEVSTMRSYRIIQTGEHEYENIELDETPKEAHAVVHIPPKVSTEEKRVSLKSLHSISKYVNELAERIEKT